MKIHAFRLTYGMDLKEEIFRYVQQHQLCAGVVLSGVGCLYEVSLRLAKGKSYLNQKQHYEIVSLNGTLSQDGVHLHISLSDEKGNVIGGHLMKGCLVNTTAEIVLLEITSYEFKREYDELSGYNEIMMKQITGK